MTQGQATIEYLALVLVGLVVACLLVRAATPVEQLAMAVVHTFVPERHRAPPVFHRARQHRTRRRVVHPCLCRFPLNLAGNRTIDTRTSSSISVTGALTE